MKKKRKLEADLEDKKVGIQGFRMVEFRTLLCCRQVTEFHKVCSLKKKQNEVEEVINTLTAQV